MGAERLSGSWAAARRSATLAGETMSRRSLALLVSILAGCGDRAGSSHGAALDSSSSRAALEVVREPGPDGSPSSSSRAVAAGSADPRASAPRPAAPIAEGLRADKPVVELPVDGFGDAALSLPLGATTRRPIVVAVHGNYNRPEGLCETWRTIAGENVFVLCPRGVLREDSPAPPDQRFTFKDVASLEREIDADLAALRARYAPFIDDGPMVYAGFSLGSIMGVFVVAHSPARFPRVVLVEGGNDRWVPDALDAFVKGGGKRVLFVSAQPECASDAAFANARLEAAGIKSEAVIGAPIGHRYDGSVAETTRGALAWLLAGDPRYGTFP
jgi:dienelactone hydrolase